MLAYGKRVKPSDWRIVDNNIRSTGYADVIIVHPKYKFKPS